MGKEIYNIINDMAEVLNASQMHKLQEVLFKYAEAYLKLTFLNILSIYKMIEYR